MYIKEKDFKEAQQLVEVLIELVQQDNDFAEYILDEYVWLCNDKRVKELQKLVTDLTSFDDESSKGV